ncbi:hypothetical protein [Pedobacter gandavensis]|uniref:hypothetical protein n=1 Tax=Pedobacter gandavensis TaxID=2679963 RepID=UPI00292DD560|nr:hypothetical protein [Pedobacter gandavensis]
MKPRHLFTSMLALTTVVVASCSAPRYAQQGAQEDDVYNSNAKAQIYTPQPRVVASQDQYYDSNDEYYGTSDPYYDMDYSSRINRFSYASPWRSYYDPYFDGGFGYGGGFGNYGFSLGLSFGSAWGNPWYGGGYYPGWGSGFYPGWGGGFYPGWGGGFYPGYPGWGGGIIVGSNRFNNAPRPSRSPGDRMSYGGNTIRGNSGNTRSDRNGNVISRGSRSDAYLPNRTQGNTPRPAGQSRIGREYNNQQQQTRPSTRESYRPQPQNTPTYSAPTRGGDGGSRSSGGGGGGGGGRSSRGGRG